MTTKKPEGLDLLRAKFPENTISKLPKPTKKQTEDLRAGMNKKDFSLGIRCKECGGWHHKDVIHLDYVGHAALTDRLLDCDPNWNWEPVSWDDQGNPQTDSIGGMWIKLTVCDVTRLGYGNADGKTGGNAIKEVIGDALRNAAMRFGAALDLWHKGDLHDDSDNADSKIVDHVQTITADQFIELTAKIELAGVDEKKIAKSYNVESLEVLTPESFRAAMRRLDLTIKQNADKPKDGNGQSDEIPY